MGRLRRAATFLNCVVAVLLVSLIVVCAGAAFGGEPAKPGVYDPYGYSDYAKFRKHIADGGRGTLYVGVKGESVGSYTPHCRVPSGYFTGIEDGVYDCMHTYGGWPHMTKRPKAKAVALEETIIAVGPGGELGTSPLVIPLTPVDQSFFQPRLPLGFGGFGGCASGTCSGSR